MISLFIKNKSIQNLIVLSNRFPHSKDSVSSVFVKSQIDILKNYIENINVIAHIPFIPHFITHYNIIPDIWKQLAYAQDYSYNNIHIYYNKIITCPLQNITNIEGLSSWKKASRIIRTQHIVADLIHAHFIWPSGFVAHKFKTQLKIPMIITAHGYDVYDFPFRNSFNMALTRNILNTSDHIITVSTQNKEIITNKIGIDRNKITVIPNGYNADHFHPIDVIEARDRLKLPRDKTIILSVGRLNKEKNYQILLEAANKILSRKKDILFFIVGDGPEKRYLHYLIQRKKLGKNIFLVGEKPHEEIPLWMNACNLFVLSSIIEGNPTVIVEAMACGKPIVAMNIGGVCEVVISNEYGLLVTPKDINDLSLKILLALQISWEKKKIVAYAKKFDWRVISSNIYELYNKILF